MENWCFQMNLEKPVSIAIETTNLCNAKCEFCPNKSLKRKKGIMSKELFEKIIEDCVEIRPRYIIPQSNGEPFMDPQFIERIKLINQKIPSAKVMFFTNAALMTPEVSDKLFELDIFSLGFSINAVDSQNYHKRMKLDYEKTISNINYFMNNNKKIKNIKFSIVDKDLTEGEKEVFLDKWRKGSFLARNINFAGLMFDVPAKNNPCLRALREMSILWDGKVSLCCVDMEGKIIFGDASENSLLEIWNSCKMKKLREYHLTQRRIDYPLCNNCNEG